MACCRLLARICTLLLRLSGGKKAARCEVGGRDADLVAKYSPPDAMTRQDSLGGISWRKPSRRRWGVHHPFNFQRDRPSSIGGQNALLDLIIC